MCRKVGIFFLLRKLGFGFWIHVGFEGLRWLSRVGFFGFDSGVLGI